MRRRWWIAGLGGALWLLLGLNLIAESASGDARLHPGGLVIALVVDGLLSFVAGRAQTGLSRGISFLKAGSAVAVALAICATDGLADMVAGFLVGGFFIADATRRGIVAAGRFEGWHRSIILAAVEVLLGLWSLLSYTLQGQGQVSFDVGLLVTHSAVGLCVSAWRRRRLPPGAPLPRVLAQRWRRP